MTFGLVSNKTVSISDCFNWIIFVGYVEVLYVGQKLL